MKRMLQTKQVAGRALLFRIPTSWTRLSSWNEIFTEVYAYGRSFMLHLSSLHAFVFIRFYNDLPMFTLQSRKKNKEKKKEEIANKKSHVKITMLPPW